MLLEIVSPEGHLYRGEVISVTVPGIDGEFQMLNNHANIVSVLTKGTIKIGVANFNASNDFSSKFIKSVKDQKFLLTVNSGTLEMRDNKITILVD